MNPSRTSRRSAPVAGVPAASDPRFRRSGGSSIRRRHAKAGLRRLLRWLGPSVVAAGLVFALAQGLVASGLLRVRQIVVVGNAHLSAGDVETLVAGLAQEQIFSVDLEHYRKRLLDSPWVADVRLTRVLPATIRIAVTERTPLAAARHGQQLYLVDKTGSIIGDYGPSDAVRNLPIVEGLMLSSRTSGPAVVPERAALAAALFDGLASRPDLRERLSEIDVSNPNDAVVLFSDDTAWLHIGDRDFGDRLQRYVESRGALVERFGRLDYVDLRFGERVFLRGSDRSRETPVAHRMK
jgi:cell division protein FtsQ